MSVSRNRRRGVALSMIFSLAGCSSATITSYQDSPGREAGGLQGYYNLPRTILDLKIDTTPVKTAAGAGAAFVALAGAAAGFDAAAGASPGAIGGAEAIAAFAARQRALGEDEAPQAVTVAANGPGAPAPAPGSAPAPAPGSAPAPGAPAPVATPGATFSFDSVTLSRRIEADPRARLLYRFEPSAFSDDVLEVDTDDAGLLTTVSSSSADRTGDIAVALADIVFTASTHGAALPKDFIAPGPAKLPFEVSFDPLDPRESTLAKRLLANQGYCLLIGPDQIQSVAVDKTGAIVLRDSRACFSPSSLSARNVLGAGYAVRYAQDNPGVYYRRPVPMPLMIVKNAAAGVDSQLVWSGNVSVLAQDDIYEAAIERGPFITKETVIKFANGSLASIKLTKPSEAYGFIQIPVKISQILFAIPLSGLQQDKSLTDAQSGLIQSQANEITAQRNLIKLQAQPGPGGVVATP